MKNRLLALLLALVALAAPPAAVAQAYETIATGDIANPIGKLAPIPGGPGDYIGVDRRGGTAQAGSIFVVKPDGTVETVASFASVGLSVPAGGLTEGPDGAFYGLSQEGGDHGKGAVYRVDPLAEPPLSVLYSFPGGTNSTRGFPRGDLLLASDGAFYGVTSGARTGTQDGIGTIFRCTTDGSAIGTGVVTIHICTSSTGARPVAGLTELADGFFVGTMMVGGQNGNGVVYTLDTNGTLAGTTYTAWAEFDETELAGVFPDSALLIGLDGNLYGTTSSGSSEGLGAVYMVDQDGVVTSVGEFTGPVGAGGTGSLVHDAQGNIYGTTLVGGQHDLGTVFRVTPAGVISAIHTFGPASSSPGAPILADGFLYGAARNEAWSIDLGATPPPPPAVWTYEELSSPSAASFPAGRLAEDAAGNLYGVSTFGGDWGDGTIFQRAADGTTAILHHFRRPDGSNAARGRGYYPASGLISGGDGFFYGTTLEGGENGVGTFFRISAAGEFTSLGSFPGGQPQGALCIGSPDGQFYAAATDGLYRISRDGVFTLLVEIADGPSGGVVQDVDGSFYGVTNAGGQFFAGSIYRAAPPRPEDGWDTWSVETVHSFSNGDPAGYAPVGELVADVYGNFYGVTRLGGAEDGGAVFHFDGLFDVTAIAVLDATTGMAPFAGLTAGQPGELFGVGREGGPHDVGTTFRLLFDTETGTWDLDVIHAFSPHIHSYYYPDQPLTILSDGRLYSTLTEPTTIWRLTPPSSEARAFTLSADPVGTTSATLRGTVNPAGAETAAWFEYQPLGEMGGSTAPIALGDGTEAVPVAQAIAGLPAHATVQYRILASGGGTVLQGEWVSFTVPNASPVAPSLTRTVAPGGTFTLNLLDSASDPDNDPVSVAGIEDATLGSGVLEDGVLTFEAGDQTGTETLRYTVTDNFGGTGVGSLTINVSDAPAGPQALFSKGGTVPGAGSDPRIAAGAVFTSFGVPSINDAGAVAFLAKWSAPKSGATPAQSGTGIFAGNPAVLVAKVGEGLMGGATIAGLKDPVLSAEGRVLFSLTRTGPGISAANNTALYTNAFVEGELTLVAAEGDAAGTGDGATLASFGSISLQGGEVLYTASLIGGSPAVTSANNVAAFSVSASDAWMIVREGQSFGQTTVKSFKLLAAVPGSPGQNRAHTEGTASFLVLLNDRTQAVVQAGGGRLEPIVQTGQTTGGEGLPEATFKSFGPVASPDGAPLAFVSTMTANVGGVTSANAKGVFVGQGGAFYPVARQAGATGLAGVTFSAFKDPVLAPGTAAVAFPATIKGTGVTSGSDSTLWWAPLGGAREMIAREGDEPAGTGAGVKWKAFTSLAIAGGESGGPLFHATLLQGAGGVDTTNDQGIWAVDSAGALQLVVREGEVIGGKTLKSFTALSAVAGSPGVTRSFNSQGQVIYRATFSDGSQALVTVQVP